MVEFVLVSVLLLVLFLMVLQVGLTLHVRNVLVSSAAEGARYAANADRSPADGEQRTREVVRQALPGSVAAGLTVTAAPAVEAGGLAVVEVRVSAPVPRLLPLPMLTLSVQGHALEEGR